MGRGNKYLHLNIQNSNLSLRPHLLQSHLTRSISVTTELRMLNEAILCNQLLELLHCGEVVIRLMLLPRSWAAGGMRHRELEDIWMRFLQHLPERTLPHSRWPGDDDWAGVFWETVDCSVVLAWFRYMNVEPRAFKRWPYALFARRFIAWKDY